MRFLVYDTEADAKAAQDEIFTSGATIAQGRGYVIDGQSIVGRRNGVPDMSAGRTTAWSLPFQRLDGKWIIAHPETHPLAVESPQLLNPIMARLGSVTVEDYEEGWFDDGSGL